MLGMKSMRAPNQDRSPGHRRELSQGSSNLGLLSTTRESCGVGLPGKKASALAAWPPRLVKGQ